MTGSEFIAEFLARIGCRHVFTLTGGACAFMIDAVGHAQLKLICVQNEQLNHGRRRSLARQPVA